MAQLKIQHPEGFTLRDAFAAPLKGSEIHAYRYFHQRCQLLVADANTRAFGMANQHLVYVFRSIPLRMFRDENSHLLGSVVPFDAVRDVPEELRHIIHAEGSSARYNYGDRTMEVVARLKAEQPPPGIQPFGASFVPRPLGAVTLEWTLKQPVNYNGADAWELVQAKYLDLASPVYSAIPDFATPEIRLRGHKVLAARHVDGKLDILVDRWGVSHNHDIRLDQLELIFEVAPLWIVRRQFSPCWDQRLDVTDYVPMRYEDEIENMSVRYNSNRANFEIEITFKEVVGKSAVTPTKPGNRIFWAVRQDRQGLSRFVEDVEAKDTRTITIILRRPRGLQVKNVWELVTAYRGTIAAPELSNHNYLFNAPNPFKRYSGIERFWQVNAFCSSITPREIGAAIEFGSDYAREFRFFERLREEFLGALSAHCAANQYAPERIPPASVSTGIRESDEELGA